MTTVKIDEKIHRFVKERSGKTGTKIERIIDDILRAWFEWEKQKEKQEQNEILPIEEE